MAASYESAPNQSVKVGDVTFAYRRIGPSSGIPLVLLMHFRGTMDHWDPALINPLAATRPVLLIDNAGVGRSTGEIPKTFKEWAQHYLDVVSALGIRQFDVLGFSMGGCVAQLVALNAPPRAVRSLILLGTTPSSGEGVVRADLGPFNRLKDAATDAEQREAFLSSFFEPSATSQAAGRASWDRIIGSRADRVAHVPANGAKRQGVAFANFMNPKLAGDASYNRFDELRMPVLIANGSNDLLLPTDNSILMWKMLSHLKAQLHLFPDAGHGFLFQYATELAKIINDFLDTPGAQDSKL
ncbi:hypothetical protein K4F52_002739 [Lecanicillium sp. MT-2017a]|nr:hypothetical protein K4F52_002739 [Lecanicillium sp. MT-2017a]